MTTFIPRTNLEPLDFDDRRRLTVSAVVMVAENTGAVTPVAYGAAVLANVVNEDEVLVMADKATARLNHIFGH